MSSGAFIVCYGVRFSIGTDGELDDAALEPLELESDPRRVAARCVGLQSYFGKDTDGGDYFLLIGKVFGPFGVHEEVSASVSDALLTETMAQTKQALAEAGFASEVGLHFQLEVMD